jgi:hypothetical protein
VLRKVCGAFENYFYQRKCQEFAQISTITMPICTPLCMVTIQNINKDFLIYRCYKINIGIFKQNKSSNGKKKSRRNINSHLAKEEGKYRGFNRKVQLNFSQRCEVDVF